MYKHVYFVDFKRVKMYLVALCYYVLFFLLYMYDLNR